MNKETVNLSYGGFSWLILPVDFWQRYSLEYQRQAGDI